MRSLIFFCSSVVVATSSAFAQPMITQSVPFQNLGSSFNEQNGVNWNLQGPGFFANFGGNNAAVPFGNPDPNAGLRTGAAFRSGGVSGNIGFNFSQGSNRSNVTTVPSLTTMNGVPGSIVDQTMRPFVTGITPVVGGHVLLPTPVPGPDPFLQSYQAAQNADVQRRLQGNVERTQKKALEYFNRGQRAEEEGNLKMARANYRRALASAQGQLRYAVQQKMLSRGW
ncbi:hypothetical protein [Planctomycetes bacterium K23_9]|uniref:Tetratricopeptide repeat protein n=1 Tax=Stieleria marina TaxID=1930275 RepID=A0A517NWI6_9BACT|nr:hypothetical protein K239x_34900 [Planctomycetes bacterium K23_9]